MFKVYEMDQQLSTGFKIPSIGLGTSNGAAEDLEKALDAALEMGYRHIDTATVYGNEKNVGNVLKKWLDSGKIKREELFVTTKLPFYNSQLHEIEDSFKQSLKDLQLEYVDLYLIHFPISLEKKQPHEEYWKSFDTDHIAMWKVLQEQVDKGKIRSLGVSNFNQKQIQKILDSKPKHKISNLQIELHVYLQQKQLVKFAHKNNIAVTAYGPLGSPAYRKEYRPTSKNLNVLNDETVNKISLKHSKTPAQILLKFLLQHDVIVIPKSVNTIRLKENFDLFNFTLDENDMKELRALDKGEKGRIFDFSFFKGLPVHPEWPFERIKEE